MPSGRPPDGSAPSSGKSGMLALLASSMVMRDSGAVAGAVDAAAAVVGRASHFLARRRSAPAVPPPPPPVSVPVRLLSGEEALLEETTETTLEQLQEDCERLMGIPTALQRLCVHEEPRDPGLVGLLRSTASHLSSRERMARSMADWSSFFLLPEGVSRELRGQGLASWLHDNVWLQLNEQQAPPGTVRVLVATLDGRRRCILVRSASNLRQLRQQVAQQAAVPAEQQRLLVLQQRELGRARRVLWSLLRLLLALLLWAGGWLLAGAMWLLLGVAPSSDVRLELVTDSGRQVQLAVSPDTTLQQLQQMVWERHGEELRLNQLSLTPSRPAATGSSCSSGGGGEGGHAMAERGDGGGGGGDGGSCVVEQQLVLGEAGGAAAGGAVVVADRGSSSASPKHSGR